MPLRLTSFGLGYVMAVPVILVGTGVYHGYRWVDHHVNYQPVTARIAAKRTVCAAFDDGTAPARWDGCGRLASLPPRVLAVLKKRRFTLLDLRFSSPADGVVHESTLVLDDHDVARGRISSLERNDVVAAWAHRRDPGAIEL